MHNNNPHFHEGMSLDQHSSETNNSENPEGSLQQEELDSEVDETSSIQDLDQDSDDNFEESSQQGSESSSIAESERLIAEETVIHIPTHRNSSSSENSLPTPLPSTSAENTVHPEQSLSMEMMGTGNPLFEEEVSSALNASMLLRIRSNMSRLRRNMRGSFNCWRPIKWTLRVIFYFTMLAAAIDSLMGGLGQLVDSMSGDYARANRQNNTAQNNTAQNNTALCPSLYSFSGQLTYEGGPLWAVAIVNLAKVICSMLALVLTAGLIMCRPLLLAIITGEDLEGSTPISSESHSIQEPPPLPDAHPLPPMPAEGVSISNQVETLLRQNPGSRSAQREAARLLGIQTPENPPARPQPEALASTSSSGATAGPLGTIQPLRVPTSIPQAPRYTPTTRGGIAPLPRMTRLSDSTLDLQTPSYTPPLTGPPPPLYSEIDFSSPPDEAGPPLSSTAMQPISQTEEDNATGDQPSGILHNSNIEGGRSHNQNHR